jgi:Ca2+-binding EF-hand superfamily protein
MKARSTLLFVTVLALGVSAARAPVAAPAYDPKAAFAQSDENGDGRVDRAEFQARLMEIFFQGDVDKDGFLSREELIVAVSFPDDFRNGDTNHDGKLSMHEFSRVRSGTFDASDADGDGLLSVEEVTAVWEKKR